MLESRGNMVMVADGTRFKVQTGLREKLGEELGDLVMDYLPPTDWGQVARVQDVQSVRMDVQLLKMELDALRRDVDRIDRTLKWFIGVNVAVFLGMYALQVQTLLLVSRL